MKSVYFILLATLFFLSASYAGGGWSHFTFYVKNNTTQKIHIYPYAPKTIAPRAWLCMTVDPNTHSPIRISPKSTGKIILAFHTIGACLGGRSVGVYIVRILIGENHVEVAQAGVGFNYQQPENPWSIFVVTKNSKYVVTTNDSNEFYVAPAS